MILAFHREGDLVIITDRNDLHMYDIVGSLHTCYWLFTGRETW